MADVKLTKVQINSVDVSAYVLKWEVDENFGNSIYSAEITLSNDVTSAVTLANSQLVEIWEGYVTTTDTKIFAGYLETYSPAPGKIVVTAFNKMYAAVRTALTAVTYDATVPGNPIYPSGKYSDAFYDLVTTYAGLTATNGTSITSSGTAHVISKLLAYNTSVKERLDAIATGLGWIYFYKASDDTVYFQPKQTFTNSLILTVGTNVSNVPEWSYDKTDLINDLRVDGAYQDSFVTETFNGDGATQSFTLTYTPTGDVSLYYSAAVNFQTTASSENQRKTLGVTGSTTSAYDFTVDKSTKVISTVGANGGGFTASAGTNNVLVQYVASIPVPVHFQDDVSIAAYLKHQRLITLTDVITVADAESRAQMVIDKFKNPFQSTTLNVTHAAGNSYNVGDSIRVVDAVNTITVDKFFTIFEVKREWPGGFDELSIGDREFDPPEFFININERLRALEQEIYNTNGILVEIRQNNFDVTVEPHSMVIDQYWLNDTPIADAAGTHPNCIIYDATQSLLLSDFESAADWAPNGSSITLSETNDSTAGHFVTATQGLNYSWSPTSGTGIIDSTVSNGDLKAVVASYALNFNGAVTSDRVVMTSISAYNFTASNDFTINCWVKGASTASSFRRVVSKAAGGTIQGYQIVHNTNTGVVGINVGDGTTQLSSVSTTITNGVWHMLTGVYDKTNSLLRWYTDGAQVGGGVAITALGTITNANNLAIGGRGSAGGGGVDYTGEVANVSVHSRALSSSEISAMFSTPTNVPSSGLVGWWKLNDNSTTTSVDSSSNANNGTITTATVTNDWIFPWQGTAGVWVYSGSGPIASSMSLRLGSSSSNYIEAVGEQYAWKVGAVTSSFALDTGLTYVLFDLASATLTGTPDWTAEAFKQIRWVVTAASNLTFDYLTISKNNTIALNGAGDRTSVKASTTYNF